MPSQPVESCSLKCALLIQFSNSSTKRLISPSFQCVLHLTVFWKPKPHNKYFQKQAPHPSLPWKFSVFSTCNFSTWKSSAKLQSGASKKWIKITIIIRNYITNVFFCHILHFERLLCPFGNRLKFGLRWYLLLESNVFTDKTKIEISYWEHQHGMDSVLH